LNGICSECGNDSYCGCSTDFECRCNYGYTGMSGFCEDIDECEDNYTCAYREGTVCYNTIGSYDCLCQEGYIMCYYSYECTPNATCPDCGVNEYCSCETDFQCRCNYGFTGVNGYCEDIDECYPYNPCESGMECTNTYGSYECSCPPGYFYCSTLYQCVSLYDVIRLEPTSVEDRYECYPYDTMDERRDIRCTVRSIIQEKINLLFNDGFPDEGPTDPTSFPTGTPVSPTGTTEYPTDTSGGSSGTSSGSSSTSGGSSGTSGGPQGEVAAPLVVVAAPQGVAAAPLRLPPLPLRLLLAALVNFEPDYYETQNVVTHTMYILFYMLFKHYLATVFVSHSLL
jgi:hypothetical protein